MVRAVQHWSHFLFQREFILYSDHEALRHLATQVNLSARHASWTAYLQQFTFILKHHLGTSNKVADALSRRALVLSELRVAVPGVELLADLYSSDPYFGSILARVVSGEIFGFVQV